MTERRAPEWHVEITETAANMIRGITDARVRRKILDLIKDLRHDPDQKGKPMVGELSGFRSLRAVGQRYRILYTLRADIVYAYVVAVGIRKEGDKADIYALAHKLLRLGLLESGPNKPAEDAPGSPPSESNL
jgi:mRNA interferase RelE/StbE